eukprot:1160850-Pelagomonas_calceolata.AAC.2
MDGPHRGSNRRMHASYLGSSSNFKLSTLSANCGCEEAGSGEWESCIAPGQVLIGLLKSSTACKMQVG